MDLSLNTTLPPTKYWLYATKYLTYRNSYVQAKLITPNGYSNGVSWFGEGASRVEITSPLSVTPYNVKLKLTYSVNSKHPHPDNYAETNGFNLYSERLIKLLKDLGIKFESFPVTMVNEEGKELTNLNYSIFHLLSDTEDIINLEASGWKGSRRSGLSKIIIDETKSVGNKMFVASHIYVQMMTDDVYKAIKQNNITGFMFLHPLKFMSGEYGSRPRYED